MVGNEVLVDSKDKQELCALLQQAAIILEQYPRSQYGVQNNTITVISRAKNAVQEALTWCQCLHIKG